MEKICAVIVTYNRKELLLECIQGVLDQTRQLDHIFILDNNSDDDTEQHLRNKNILENPLISFVKLPSNMGGAGGFYEGVKKAFDANYDWLWLMDDDVEPEKDCLEKMLNYSESSKCLHPTKRYTENGEIFTWQGHFDPITSFSHRYKIENFRDAAFTKVNFGCFEGMLIHRDIIEKIGFPDKKFFIVGDDLIYGYLASKYTDVLYLRDPEFKKKIFKTKRAKFLFWTRPYHTAFFTYFNIRNHFLKKDYLLTHGDGSKLKINTVLFLKNLKVLIEVLFFFRTWQHFKMFYWGLIDGLGRNFNGHRKFIK